MQFASRFAWMTVLFVIFALPAMAQQQNADVVAKVSRLQNAAVAIQDALPRPLTVGSDVQLGDIVSTGKGTRLELTFSDGTMVTLGERTQFSVVEFVVDQNGGNAVMRLMKGAFEMTSGSMMKMAQATMTVETETATIGIRGTHFWGGPLDGEMQVVLLGGKGVYVETKAGRVNLALTGAGTRIPSRNRPPSQPRPWEKSKLDRAAAATAFTN